MMQGLLIFFVRLGANSLTLAKCSAQIHEYKRELIEFTGASSLESEMADADT